VIFLIGRFFFSNNWSGGWQIVGETLSGNVFWSAAMVGFLAQVIDGALGMAYGVTATTFLLATGATPGAASASVHIAEIFTTGVSGISHVKFGNVNKDLFMRLLVPGILGGIIGAILVTQIDGAEQSARTCGQIGLVRRVRGCRRRRRLGPGCYINISGFGQ
jgi:hypothetical protein